MGMGNEQAILLEQEPRVHRITVEEFLALDEAGFFEEVGRVELIEGEIIEMAPLWKPHGRVLIELTTALSLAVRGVPGIEAFTPVSAKLDPHSLPEADLVVANVVEGDDDKYLELDQVRLMIEASASSLHYDLGRKQRLYARSGVPEYWVVDVYGRTIIRMHAPEGEAYRERAEFAFGETVPSATIEGLSIDTSRLA
jgi:Uma2 family endonuclease